MSIVKSEVRTLNDAQRAFCAAPGGALRLLAPAGCGKTQSLLWRCLHVAEREKKGEKSKFLLFTFTTGARDELKERIHSDPAFKPISSQVTITTLNAWGYKRLKAAGHNLQLKTTKTDRFFALNNVLQPVWTRHPRIASVLTDSRRRNVASAAIMDLIDRFKALGFRHDKVTTEAAFLKQAVYLEACGMKAQLTRIAQELEDHEILARPQNPLESIFDDFVGFWREATAELYERAIISYEDQKYWSMIEVDGQKAKKTFWTGAARHPHILVDEFQDINPLDLMLLKAIADINKADLTVVGDDDQAIYEWRGATPDFVLEPEKHIGKPYETIVLGMNYRSPRNIVELSQKLIANNKRRVAKKVSAHGSGNARVDAHRVPRLADAIDFVVAHVKALLAEGKCKNVAIMGRKRSQIIPYQIVFASQGIRFYAAEDLNVFLSRAFEQLRELLSIRSRADEAIAKYGLSPVNDLMTLCDKVKRFQLAKKDSEALRAHLVKSAPKTTRAALQALTSYKGSLKGNSDGRMTDSFAEAIRELLDSKTVAASIGALSEHFDGLQKDYGKSLDDIFYTDPPFLYLGEYAQRYGEDYQTFSEDMEKAIATLARVPPEDAEDAEHAWKLPLHLMTALRAKGKEFDAVVILDANEGIWPIKLAESEFDLEAERRMFYVAMTRVRKHLVFLVNDVLFDQRAKPTRYLAEMGIVPTPLSSTQAGSR